MAVLEIFGIPPYEQRDRLTRMEFMTLAARIEQIKREPRG